MQPLDLAELDVVCGSGQSPRGTAASSGGAFDNFKKNWLPDVKQGLGTGVTAASAGALCFGGVSTALGGTFFVPEAAPVWAPWAAHAAGYGCSGLTAVIAHHYLSR